jgi:hypothetical protein
MLNRFQIHCIKIALEIKDNMPTFWNRPNNISLKNLSAPGVHKLLCSVRRDCVHAATVVAVNWTDKIQHEQADKTAAEITLSITEN